MYGIHGTHDLHDVRCFFWDYQNQNRSHNNTVFLPMQLFFASFTHICLHIHTPLTFIESSLIITGEWCHEVFAEYALNTDATVVPVSPDQVDRKTIEQVGFKGRGVQYYLGFHHGPDSCRYDTQTLCVKMLLSRVMQSIKSK